MRFIIIVVIAIALIFIGSYLVFLFSKLQMRGWLSALNQSESEQEDLADGKEKKT